MPDRWNVVSVRHLAAMQSGEGITSSDIDDDGAFRVFGGNGVRGYTSAFTHDGEFVLIGRQGALCGNVHRASGRFWASEHAVVARPRGHHAVWLAHVLGAMNLGQYSVAAAQPGLAVDRIKALLAPVPPIDEQRAIADFLDEKTAAIDALIAKKERLLALLDEKRQALITQAVTKGLDPSVPMKDSGVEWLGLIPTSWRVMSVKRLTAGAGGLFTDGDWIEAPFIRDDGVRLLQTGNVGIGRYKEQGFRYVSDETFDALRCTEVRPNDVLVCRLDGPVGRACLAPDLGVRMITSVDNAILRVTAGTDPRFVAAIMTSQRWLAWIQALCRVGGGFRFRISRQMLGELRVPVPPIDVQHRLADHLDAITKRTSAVADKVERHIERLREYRQAVITATVTGQLDVRSKRAREMEPAA